MWQWSFVELVYLHVLYALVTGRMYSLCDMVPNARNKTLVFLSSEKETRNEISRGKCAAMYNCSQHPYKITVSVPELTIVFWEYMKICCLPIYFIKQFKYFSVTKRVLALHVSCTVFWRHHLLTLCVAVNAVCITVWQNSLFARSIEPSLPFKFIFWLIVFFL